MTRKRFIKLLMIVLAIITMAGCAKTPQNNKPKVYDIDKDLAFISKLEGGEWVSEEEWRQNH